MAIVEVFRTSIKLGSISIDAYTADEQDNDGNWINYLSGAGMAEAIKLHRSTTLQNRLSDDLKALLGNDFTTLQSKYRMNSGGLSKVELWKTADARKFWRFHDRKGNQKASLIVDALVEVSLDIIINDAFNRAYKRGDAEKLVNRILNTPNPWKRLYEPEFCDTVFKWYGAQFYWEFCYNFLTPHERCKLNELNPPVKGERKKRIHQYLENETRIRLEPYILQLIAVFNSSRNKQQFADNYQRHFGKAIQQELELNY